MNKGEAIVLHNLLPENVAAQLRETLLGSYFQWYWSEYTLYEQSSPHFDKTISQFTHVFCLNGTPNSELNILAQTILAAVEERTPIRITHVERTKANLLCSIGDVDLDQRFEIHVDVNESDEGNDWYSAVYYVGESDGDTVLFADSGEETARVPHKNNSAAVFNSRSKHRASLPRKHKRRVVINLVFRGDA